MGKIVGLTFPKPVPEPAPDNQEKPAEPAPDKPDKPAKDKK